MDPKKNPFAWIVGIGATIVLILSGWLNSNQNWDNTRQQPIPDVRIRE